LEEEPTSWHWNIAYTAGYSHLVKGMLLHGPLLTWSLPLTAWETVGGALFFGVGYQHHLDPMASRFSFAIHRPYAEVGLQIRLFERVDGAFQIGLSARVAALFQTISPSPERPGETLVSWNPSGALHLASEHRINPQTALVWGITAEFGGVDLSGTFKPAFAILGQIGLSFFP
jgi:hypothetical protein